MNRFSVEEPEPARPAPARVPAVLQAGIDRHRAHVAELEATLRGAGLPDAQIIASVEMLVATYRSALARTLTSLTKADHDAR